jgi:hypothetical protein
MPDRLKPFVLFFAALAALGLALSIISHVAALLGRQGPLGEYTFALHVGVFVVWLPAVLVSRHLAPGLRRKGFWQAAFRGCPPWMRFMVYGLFVYGFLNFIVFLTHVPPNRGPGFLSPSTVRGFSGHWMIFYATAMAILYSAGHVNDRDGRDAQRNLPPAR